MGDERPVAESGLQEILRVVRQRLWVIALCIALAAGAAFVFSAVQEKQYSASASLLFRDANLDQTVFGGIPGASEDPDREAATNVQLVSLGVVGRRTAKRLDDPTVSDNVEVAAAGKSNVATIKATYPDPGHAARVANALAEEYIDFRRDADRSTVRQAQRLVETQLAGLSDEERKGERGKTLTERQEQLQLLTALQTGNAELVQRAEVPSSPSSPKTRRNTALGGFLGLLLGVALAFVVDRLDRRVKDPKEVERLFGRPLLAAVPQSAALSRENGKALPAGEAEAFRMLRANLRYFNVKQDIRSVLVTSAAPGDGKSTVAYNLAAMAASAGSRVLLIEADLRRPTLERKLGLSHQAGLSAILTGDSELEPAVHRVKVSQGVNGGSVQNELDVLVAGPLPPNPPDLLESERMEQLIHRAESEYDLVVIDTPPTSVVSDAIPLMQRVNGVIVVTRLGTSTREGATRLRDQLNHLDAPTLGIVVNAIELKGAHAGYGYGYDAPEDGAR